MPVSVTNRQRKIAVDLKKVESTVNRLWKAVASNLSENPVKHLRRKQVQEIYEAGEVSLILVSNAKIKELNRDFRGKNAATDVLSFPLSWQRPAVADMPFEVGEIVISMERCREQAKDLGHSQQREFAFLFVHGALHILGFDHITKEQESEMFGRQTKILDSAGFPRR